MAGKKSKKRKRRRPLRRGSRELLSRIERKGLLKGREILHQPEGYEKISAVVWDFIAPYMKHATNYEALSKLITLALLAWNASMLPDDEAKAMVEKVVDSQPLSKCDRKMMMDVVADLIERKKRHFAHYTVDILDYELTETKDEFRLSVASFVKGDKNASEKQ